MAFNLQTFRTRTVTAVIFAAIMLVGLLWNKWSFLALFSIIHFGCWWEYLRITEKIRGADFHPYTKLGFMVTGYGIMLWFCGPAYHIYHYGLKENISLPVSAAGFGLLLTGIFHKNALTLKAFGMAAAGLIYVSLCWGLMMDLYKTELSGTIFDGLHVNFIPLMIVFTIWINDTMAYIAGSLIGKTPFSKISPKKTWEGTIGGILLAIGVMGLLVTGLPDSPALRSYTWFVLPAIAAIAGTIGDLWESKLKRMAGLKDSGSIMPGHGGFLDRFDSLLLAIPFVWLFVQLFMK